MEEFMAALVVSLAPFGARWDSDNGVLRIGDAQFQAYEGRNGMVSLNYIRYRPTGRGRNRGYDVGPAMLDIVRSLPGALKSAERRKTIQDVREMFKEVTGQDKEPLKRCDGKITVGIDGDQYYVTIFGKDLMKLLVMCDMIEEQWM